MLIYGNLTTIHVKLVACADERSELLYNAAMESLAKLWTG